MSLLKEIVTCSYLGLNNTNRYSNTKLSTLESTASHEMDMQLIALFLYEKFPEEMKNIKDIIWRILMHDLDECPTSGEGGFIESLGDIPRDVKYKNKDTIKLFKDIAEDILHKAIKSEYIINNIKNSKHDNTFEGAITDVIDNIQAMIKLRSEWIIQGKDFIIKAKYRTSFEYLEDKIEIYDENGLIPSNIINYLIELVNEFKEEYNRCNVMNTSVMN